MKDPSWLRKLEKLTRLEFTCALKACAIADHYDVIIAMSENVGLPLAWMPLHRPLVVLAHHMAHPIRQPLGRLSGIDRKWTRIGYVTNKDKDFMISHYHISPHKFFRFLPAPLRQFSPGKCVSDGPIISIGVAKRDYVTLIAALEQSPRYQTEIFVSSRYGDVYGSKLAHGLPEWIHLHKGRFMTSQEVADQYRWSRFVAVPLVNTTQFSAGVTSALEAASAGKALIATDTPGIRDYVVDGVTGLLVPPGDVSAWQGAIRELWNAPSLAHQMGLAGRQHMERNFDPDQISSQWNRMLCDICSEFQMGSHA